MEHYIKKLTDITYTSELTLDILINGNAPKCQGLNSHNNLRRTCRTSGIPAFPIKPGACSVNYVLI